MPAKNIHHDVVITALQADGWTITDDSYRLMYGGQELSADPGTERILAAGKDTRRIAVVIQSFPGPSPVRDLQRAVGQFEMYREVLAEQEPERTLYLAVSNKVYDDVFLDRLGQLILTSFHLRLVIYDPAEQRIVRWIE
jgi:hypothetical protein